MREGGSYVRDPKTGDVKRVEGTFTPDPTLGQLEPPPIEAPPAPARRARPDPANDKSEG